jgi:hypothetical protein
LGLAIVPDATVVHEHHDAPNRAVTASWLEVVVE